MSDFLIWNFLFIFESQKVFRYHVYLPLAFLMPPVFMPVKGGLTQSIKTASTCIKQ